MSKANERLGKRSAAIQAFLTQAEPNSDLSADEIAAHKGMIRAFDGAEEKEGVAKTLLLMANDKAKRTFDEVWEFCLQVEGIASAKAPNEAVRASLDRGDTSGGFSTTRARKRVNGLLGLLVQFGDDFTALGLSKPEIVSRLEECLTVDKAVAAKRSFHKGARAGTRLAAKDLHKENNRIMMIQRAIYPPGSTLRKVLDDTVPPASPPRKKKTELKKSTTEDASTNKDGSN